MAGERPSKLIKMHKLKAMPATPMTQEEMEAQCRFVSSVAHICEAVSEDVENNIERSFDNVSDYKSRSAREARDSGYGDRSYWNYLEQSAHEHHDYYVRHGDQKRADEMFTQSLADALRGNEGD